VSAARRLVVVGGDAAGMSAAAAARRADPDLAITVLERGEDVSYAACGLPYWISGEVGAAEDLVAHDAAYFRERRRIDVRLGADAVEVDPAAGEVHLADGGRVGYDALVLATGARAVRPPVPGADLDGVLPLRDLASGRRVQERLRGLASGRAVVVGLGAIGVEGSEALRARGLDVVVVELLERPLPMLPDEVLAPLVAALEAGGVQVRTGAGLEAIEPAGGGQLAVTVDGERLDADLVLLGAGVQPASGLARGAGCRLGQAGAIAVDRRCRTSVPGLWAAGDCATAWHRVLGRDVWMPLATTANRQGRAAGGDVTGGGRPFPGIVGSWVSSGFGVGFGATGIDAAAAREAGFLPRTIVRTADDRSGYIPGGRPVTIALVWDELTGRLLGAQASGEGGVSTRLHTLALAIGAGLSVRDLAEADLGYVPPLSPLRDVVERVAAAAVGDAP
jgi:CoA-dependent NAD(P)H sulfur oxidoreductase